MRVYAMEVVWLPTITQPASILRRPFHKRWIGIVQRFSTLEVLRELCPRLEFASGEVALVEDASTCASESSPNR